MKNKVEDAYKKIKLHTTNFFDTAVLKYFLFPFNNPNVTKHKKNTSLMPLSIYVKQLKNTIESSKNFIRSIIENIRYKGKIKIINQSNHNPTHEQNQSSFPDLETVIVNSEHNQDNYYPFDRFDQTFDAEKRKEILKIDSDFKNRMKTSIQKSYYHDFFNEYKWTVLNEFNTLQNIDLIIQKFQEKYEYLKLSNKLEDSFMMDSNPFLIMIDNHLIPIDSRKKMIEDFKNIVPNIEHQILISTYANKKFLREAYLEFMSKYPEMNQYKLINSQHTYKIYHLNDGAIKLVATHRSDLENQNNYSTQKQHKSFGIRATIVFPPNHEPIMKYSHFLN